MITSKTTSSEEEDEEKITGIGILGLCISGVFMLIGLIFMISILFFKYNKYKGAICVIFIIIYLVEILIFFPLLLSYKKKKIRNILISFGSINSLLFIIYGVYMIIDIINSLPIDDADI